VKESFVNGTNQKLQLLSTNAIQTETTLLQLPQLPALLLQLFNQLIALVWTVTLGVLLKQIINAYGKSVMTELVLKFLPRQMSAPKL